MQITVDTDTLSSLVSNANSILKKGQTIRIVAHEGVTDEVGSISVVSFEDTTVSAWHGAAEIQRPGSIAIRGDSLDRFLKLSSKSDKTIKLETIDVDNRSSLRVITTRGAHEFDGFPEEVFEQVDPGQSQVQFGDLKDFADALKIAKSTTPPETEVIGARISLSGVHIRPQGEKFHVVGTDGKRLSLCILHSNALKFSDIPAEGVTIPGRMVAMVANIIGTEPAAIRIVDNTLIAENGEGSMSLPLIDADYPNYLSLLNFQGEHSLSIPGKMIQTAIERSSAAIGQEDRYLTATLLRDIDGIHLSSRTSKESSSELISTESGDECEISFNVSFMKRAIANIDVKNLQIQFTHVSNPILITSEERPDLTMMVMPCKANSTR
jgi:DNA polymerase III sliding clamp (beta) subunit (PCNA family)